jgi:ParB-like chromosome segregation protein Spo0J
MKMLGMVPVDKLKPNEWNAIELPAEDEAKLKAQMRISGPEKTEALTVRRAGDVWEIVNGEKRWHIAKQLGWTHLPAVEIEISDYELKKYCLSYNLLRGTVNYVKLSKLLLKDEEMVKVCRELLGEEKTQELIESGKRLTKQAEEMLEQAVRKGSDVTPEKIKVVSEAPPEHQPELAAAAEEETDVDYMLIVRERLAGPPEEKKEEGEEQKPPKPPKPPKTEIFGKAVEAVSEFKCTCGQGYVVLYDREKKAIQVRPIKEAEGVRAMEGLTAAPKIYQIELKVDVPGTWIGEVDAETGEYHFKRVEE